MSDLTRNELQSRRAGGPAVQADLLLVDGGSLVAGSLGWSYDSVDYCRPFAANRHRRKRSPLRGLTQSERLPAV
jgi:hypothetical protein